MQEIFTTESGANVLRQLTFEQQETNVVQVHTVMWCLCLFANQGNTTCQTYRDRQKQTVRETNRQTERHTDNMTNLTKLESSH